MPNKKTKIQEQGIYMIQNIVNHKVYIGRSSNIKKREGSHFSALSRNKHSNYMLQLDYMTHGREVFEFKLLLQLKDMSDSRRIEKDFIDKYPKEQLYNTSNPLTEWNKHLDKASIDFDNIPIELKDKIEYHELEDLLMKTFHKTFLTIKKKFKYSECWFLLF